MRTTSLEQTIDDDGQKAKAGRTRRAHTRSRAGCVTCKQRHVRCDETTPTCNKCATTNRCCKYEPAKLPLRERRAQEREPLQPGEQKPWLYQTGQTENRRHLSSKTSQMALVPSKYLVALTPSPWQHGLAAEMDPFDSMFVGMRYRTRDLLLYFCAINGCTSVDRQKGWVHVIMKDPVILRNSLLLAGLHHRWKTGQPKSFESTFLYHKIQVMHTVNKWLQELGANTAQMCIRHVAMLFFVEYSLGNKGAAEAHLQALVALFGWKPNDSTGTKSTGDYFNRYLIVLYYFQVCFNMETTHLSAQKASPTCQHGDPGNASDPADLEKGGQALSRFTPERVSRFLPLHHSALYAMKAMKDADALSLLDEILEVSNGDQWYSNLALQENAEQRQRMGRTPQTNQPAAIPLIALGSTTSMLFHTLVISYKNEAPLEVRFYMALLRLLRRDLSGCEYHSLYLPAVDEDTGTFPERDFFIWRAFIGAFSLYKALGESTGIVGDDTYVGRIRGLGELQFCFEGFIKRWSEAVGGVSDWNIAKEALARNLWPEASLDMEMAEVVWKQAIRP